jgi:hypothetical protein
VRRLSPLDLKMVIGWLKPKGAQRKRRLLPLFEGVLCMTRLKKEVPEKNSQS